MKYEKSVDFRRGDCRDVQRSGDLLGRGYNPHLWFPLKSGGSSSISWPIEGTVRASISVGLSFLRNQIDKYFKDTGSVSSQKTD